MNIIFAAIIFLGTYMLPFSCFAWVHEESGWKLYHENDQTCFYYNEQRSSYDEDNNTAVLYECVFSGNKEIVSTIFFDFNERKLRFEEVSVYNRQGFVRRETSDKETDELIEITSSPVCEDLAELASKGRYRAKYKSTGPVEKWMCA